MNDDFIEAVEVGDILDRAIATLNSREKAVIEKIREGHSLTETARLLGIPKQTASSRKESASKKMQQFVKKVRTI